jgi:FlaG/FlaF family flagellin (archaellin)
MVAIVIILVAVVGSFVLDVGGAVSETVPSATITITETTIDKDGSAPAETAVVIAHQGGDVMEQSQVTTQVNGEPAKDWDGDTIWTGSGTISAGDSATVMRYGSGDTELTSGDRLVVVWRSASGQTSFKLAEYVVKG